MPKRPPYPSLKKKRKASKKYGGVRTGGFSNIERKFVDYEYNAVVVNTVAGSEADPSTPGCISAVAQGDGESQRDGRKYLIKSINIKGYVQWPSYTASASVYGDSFVRFLVVLDTQTNGAQLNAEDVLADPTSTDLDAVAFRNLQYTSRFKVLKDMIILGKRETLVHNGTNYDSSNMVVPFECYITKDIPVTTSATGATVSTITDNSIHVIAIYSQGAQPTMRYMSRVRYEG